MAHYPTFNFSSDFFFASIIALKIKQKSRHSRNGMLSNEPRGMSHLSYRKRIFFSRNRTCDGDGLSRFRQVLFDNFVINNRAGLRVF